MTQYAGISTSYPVSIPLVDDLFPPTSLEYNPGLQGLADRTAFLKAALGVLQGQRQPVLVVSASNGSYVTVHDTANHVLLSTTFAAPFLMLPTDIIVAFTKINQSGAADPTVSHAFDIQAVNASGAFYTLNTVHAKYLTNNNFDTINNVYLLTPPNPSPTPPIVAFGSAVGLQMITYTGTAPSVAESFGNTELFFMVLR